MIIDESMNAELQRGCEEILPAQEFEKNYSKIDL